MTPDLDTAKGADLAKEAEELLALDAARTQGDEWAVEEMLDAHSFDKECAQVLLIHGRGGDVAYAANARTNDDNAEQKANAAFIAAAPRMAFLIKRLLSERAVWQPISTAPRDGTEIILYFAHNGEMRIGHWITDWPDSSYPSVWVNHIEMCLCRPWKDDPEPTLWMHKPAPPAAVGAGEQ